MIFLLCLTLKYLACFSNMEAAFLPPNAATRLPYHHHHFVEHFFSLGHKLSEFLLFPE